MNSGLRAASLLVLCLTGSALAGPGTSQRWVSLAPALTLLIDQLGACDLLLAQVGQPSGKKACPGVPDIARGAQWSDELVLALHPDKVLVWTGGIDPRRVQTLQRLHLNLYFFDPHSPQDVAASISRMGALAGQELRAARLRAHFEQQALHLRQAYGGLAWLNVFFQVWPQPLMTLAADHYVAQALALCHLRLRSPREHGTALQVSSEWTLTEPLQAVIVPEDQSVAPALSTLPWLHADTSSLERPDATMLDGLGSLCAQVRAKARS